MKTTINEYQFEQAFVKAGRGEQFSREALKALFEYIEGLEEDLNEEIELDVIGLCCEFTEYEDLDEFQNAYSDEYQTIDDIEYETIVIPIAGTDGFIIQDF